MNRPVLIHGGLLIAALITAYFVWTREPTGAEDAITIVSLRGALDKAIYVSDDRTVTVTRKKDEAGPYHWLKVETKKAPRPMPRPKMRPRPPAPKAPVRVPVVKPRPRVAPAPRAIPRALPTPAPKPRPRVAPAPAARPIPRVVNKPLPRVKINPKAAPDPTLAPKATPQINPAPKITPATPTPATLTPPHPTPATAKITPPVQRQPPKKVRTVKEFLGNKAADVLMEGLAGLSAIRSLGKVDSDKLKSFGLAESKKTLTLVSGSTPRVFVIGDNTFGNSDTYLLSKDDGRVYVIRPRLLQDFLYAESRLMERELKSFRITEVDRVVATAGKQRRALLQKNPSEPANAYWVDEAAPEQRKDFYRNWFDKLNRLRAVEYVPERNKITGLTPVFELSYFGNGKPKGALKVLKKATLIPGVTGAAPTGGGDYYVESTHNRTQVKISKHLGDELARDIKNLFKE